VVALCHRILSRTTDDNAGHIIVSLKKWVDAILRNVQQAYLFLQQNDVGQHTG
jgi:hypothetical protein